MAKINPKKKSSSVTDAAHANWMGGPSYFLSDPIKQLALAATSCFFGEPQYYHREKGDRFVKGANPSSLTPTDLKRLRELLGAVDPQEWRGLAPAELMVKAIDKALDFDPEQTLLFAVELRQKHHIRTTPQVILVRAAHHPKVKGKDWVRKYAKEIIGRTDEPAVGLAYHLATYGEKAPIPNSLKRAWKDHLENTKAYKLAKYRLEDHEVKLVDVVNLVHPKSSDIGKLVKGELKNTETWEAIISKEGSTKDAWVKALEHIGHMALLRNIRNLEKVGVNHGVYLKKLVDGAKDGKQLPFRYYSAIKAIGEGPGPIKDAIEECMIQSMGELPKFPGRSMFLCDNSGSAWGATTSSMGTMHIAEIANLTGVIGGHLAEDGYVGVFGDRLSTVSISKKGGIFSQLEKVTKLGQDVGGGTENGIWLFWDKAIRNKEHWDNVFVFSDMQAGHGGLYGISGVKADYIWQKGSSYPYIDVPKLIKTYRAQVNPDVNVFLIQVAGYQDTIIPEYYKRTYILGGWGEGIFTFAHQMAGMMNQQ